jgi:hypothetical protein
MLAVSAPGPGAGGAGAAGAVGAAAAGVLAAGVPGVAGGGAGGTLAGDLVGRETVAADFAAEAPALASERGEQPVSVITVRAAATGMAARAGRAARRAMPDDVARNFMT